MVSPNSEVEYFFADYSLDAQFVAVGTSRGVEIWHYNTAQQKYQYKQWLDTKLFTYELVFLGANMLVVASSKGNLSYYVQDPGTSNFRFKQDLIGFYQDVFSVSSKKQNNGSFLVAGGADGIIQIFIYLSANDSYVLFQSMMFAAANLMIS
jgi:WD40 repeat protein